VEAHGDDAGLEMTRSRVRLPAVHRSLSCHDPQRVVTTRAFSRDLYCYVYLFRVSVFVSLWTTAPVAALDFFL